MTPAELYQAEKAKRLAVGVKAVLPTKLVERLHHVTCPSCGSDHWRIDGMRSRRAQAQWGTRRAMVRRRLVCLDCEHRWSSGAAEVLGTVRNVECRG